MAIQTEEQIVQSIAPKVVNNTLSVEESSTDTPFFDKKEIIHETSIVEKTEEVKHKSKIEKLFDSVANSTLEDLEEELADISKDINDINLVRAMTNDEEFVKLDSSLKEAINEVQIARGEKSKIISQRFAIKFNGKKGDLGELDAIIVKLDAQEDNSRKRVQSLLIAIKSIGERYNLNLDIYDEELRKINPQSLVKKN